MRYCDKAVNPRYNGRQDDPVNPINCTWGFHRPPPLPESEPASGACLNDPEAILAARRAEPTRSWTSPGGGRRSEFGGSKGRQSWSTRDRPGYLYRNYM